MVEVTAGPAGEPAGEEGSCAARPKASNSPPRKVISIGFDFIVQFIFIVNFINNVKFNR
jgi:hypothetical protein